MPPPEREEHATLALIGLRCSGKTSVGRALAALLDRPFVDLDEALTARARLDPELSAHQAAGELFAAVGEARFRGLEASALEHVLASPTPSVLATGGGVVETLHCRALLGRSALCVWLNAPTRILAARLRADPHPRPSLTGLDPAHEMDEIASRREASYAALAAMRLDSAESSVTVLARTIAQALDPSAQPRFRLLASDSSHGG